MKTLFRSLVLLTGILLTAVPLMAQDDQPPQLPLNDAGSYTIAALEGVEVLPVSEFENLFGDLNGIEGRVITLGRAVILTITPDQVSALASLPEGPEVNSMAYIDSIFEVLDGIYDGAVPRENTTDHATPIAGFFIQGVRYLGMTGDEFYENYYVLIFPHWPTNDALFAHIVVPVGGFVSLSRDLDALFETLAFVEIREGFAGGGGTGPTGGTLGVCTVTAETERSATVRVGPGEHRTALMFLKANRPYTVEGRSETDAGDVWYRLVKEEVDPGTSAAELWTAAEGLIEAGACATVGEAAAPPLRPIIPGGRPTAVPGDTSGGATADVLIPASGTWVINYAERATMSCAGGGFGDFPIAEIGIPSTETIEIFAAPDGSALFIDGYAYARISDSAYVGDYDFGDANGQVYLFPQSANNMSLELRANVVVQGVACSATIYASANRQ